MTEQLKTPAGSSAPALSVVTGSASYRYRIKPRLFGFEPQMQFIASLTGRKFWTPLLPNGYWAEPESISFGGVVKKYPISLRAALRAIHNAKQINAR